MRRPPRPTAWVRKLLDLPVRRGRSRALHRPRVARLLPRREWTCDELVDKQAACERDWVYNCGKTLDDVWCTSDLPDPDSCWGQKVCPNPPPEWTCDNLTAQVPDCNLGWLVNCGKQLDVLCTSNLPPPYPLEGSCWGQIVCPSSGSPSPTSPANTSIDCDDLVAQQPGCEKDWVYQCGEGGLALCTGPELPGSCPDGSQPQVCPNPPPEFTCDELLEKQATCEMEWVYNCGKTLDNVLCTSDPPAPGSCWGYKVCPNPPPEWTCDELLAQQPGCEKQWVYNCGKTLDDVQCTSNLPPPYPLEGSCWGQKECPNPPPEWTCDDLTAQIPDCNKGWLVNCGKELDVLCTSDPPPPYPEDGSCWGQIVCPSSSGPPSPTPPTDAPTDSPTLSPGNTAADSNARQQHHCGPDAVQLCGCCPCAV